jgi:hypothetical protein
MAAGTIVVALMVPGLVGAGSAGGRYGPGLEEPLAPWVDQLEREVSDALLAPPRSRETMRRVVEVDLRRIERRLRTLDSRERRAAALALRRVHGPLAQLGLEGVVRAVPELASAAPAAAVGTGQIIGQVRDALTSSPIPGASVAVAWMPCGGVEVASSPTTDAAGAYATSANLLPGTYYVYAQHPSFIGEIHSGEPCAGTCYSTDAVTRGTPVTVGSGAVVVDFFLSAGGAISGTVTNASTNAPLEGITVRWFDKATHRWGRPAFTDASGNYVLGGLLAGSYTLSASNYGLEPVLDQVYDGMVCPGFRGCNPTLGTPVTVAAGSVTSGIDFALPVGGQISGTVFPADDFTSIYLFDAGGSYRGYGYVEPDGTYVTNALETGTYYAAASPNSLYMDKPFGGPPCVDGFSPGCRTTGSPIGVTAGNTTSGIDFLLQTGGSVEGTIGGGLCGDVEIYDASGTYLNLSTSGCGAYATPPKLTTGTYYVLARANGGGWIPQLYNGLPCAGCAVTGGTPVAVTAGSATGSIDFALTTGSVVSGSFLTNTGGYLPALSVEIYNSSGSLAGGADLWGFGATCSASWTAPDGFPAGTYYALARTWAATTQPYRPQLHSGIDCGAGCSPTSGTPIVVDGTTGVSNVDFGLVPQSPLMDLNADRRGDILWRHSGGDVYVWMMDGVSLTASGFLPSVSTAWDVEALGDFNGDRKADLLWRHLSSGTTYLWFLDGTRVMGEGFTSSGADPSWAIQDTGDLDGDGREDILWRHSSGATYAWLMEGRVPKAGSGSLPLVGLDWEVVRMGDFDGDARSDILWRHTTGGETYLWQMDGTTITAQGFTSSLADTTWTVSGVGDMDGNGTDDILWRHDSGAIYAWLMDGTTVGPGSGFLPAVSTVWAIKGLRDYTGDGRADILWRHTTGGDTYLWEMDGTSKVAEGFTAPQTTTDWTIQLP